MIILGSIATQIRALGHEIANLSKYYHVPVMKRKCYSTNWYICGKENRVTGYVFCGNKHHNYRNSGPLQASGEIKCNSNRKNPSVERNGKFKSKLQSSLTPYREILKELQDQNRHR
ncbi:hypothetical protein TNCV_1517201 [Trichonephila clavipes]|nr:hypothetical protein TNCV_1517201 [Trichonephila clavipes]